MQGCMELNGIKSFAFTAASGHGWAELGYWDIMHIPVGVSWHRGLARD
jgi:hypothetical protein